MATRHWIPLAAALLLLGATPGQVPEPIGLWQGVMHGYTPNTLRGASVIDTPSLSGLLAEHPILVDVAEADHKPEAMAKTTLWLPAHRTIPGADWLPGGGSGSADPHFAASFRSRIAALTGDDRAKPIVAFCHPDCWGSWNAAKRLVGLGYTRVYWYPEGMEGWQAEHETAIVKQDPSWSAPDGKVQTQ